MPTTDTVTIIGLDRISLHMILVNYSDLTYATYTAKELLSLGNERIRIDEVGQNDV